MFGSSTNRDSSQKNARTGGKKVTKRALNLPVLAGTLVAVAVLSPAAYFWHAFQVRRTADGSGRSPSTR